MRRALVASLLVALAGGGALTAAASAGRVVAADARRPPAVCGPGLVALDRGTCVHAAADTAIVVPPAARATTAVAPRCYGDGRSGPRVQLVYAYVEGTPDRSRTVVPAIRSRTAPRMEQVVRAQAEGQDLGIRFAFEPGCRRLSVPVVRVPRAVLAQGDDPMRQFPVIIRRLEQLGMSSNDRKYLVVFDRPSANGVCGLGELAAEWDLPGAVNPHEGVVPVVAAPRYAAVWRVAFNGSGPPCWNTGRSGALVEVHELFHTLGAVQLNAPNSDGAGHCVDAPSVMCPSQGAVLACVRAAVEPLDCRQDDYWDPTPELGSYLSTAHNIARSRFFGPQPGDSLGR